MTSDESIPIQTWQVIDETEFSEFVSKHYGRPYRLQQQEPMMGQDTITRIEVSSDPADHETGTNPYRKEVEDRFQSWLAADPNLPVPAEKDRPGPAEPEEWLQPGGLKHQLHWERDFYPDLDEVLSDLHRKGILPAGDYKIHAWW